VFQYWNTGQKRVKNKIADLVSTVGYNSHCSVSCVEVLFAVCKLKPGIDDGDIGLSSDYFLNARIIISHLT